MKKKYDSIISLGFFCSTALELERVGLRSHSSPFDWVLSLRFDKVIELIENNFENFLNIDYLQQYRSNPSFYMNSKYDIHFYHDFNKYKTLEMQIKDIEIKYKRRISRFYESIKNKTLFIRYISSEEECIFIENNLQKILSIIKKYNKENDIIFIINDDIKHNLSSCFSVKKDNDDTVARTFIEKNEELRKFLMSGIYDYENRKKNIKIINTKKIKQKRLNKFNRCIRGLKKIILKPKIHSSIYEK